MRKWMPVVLVSLVALGVVSVVAFSGDDGFRTVRVDELGVTADVPDGWHVRPQEGEPRLSLYLEEPTFDDQCVPRQDCTKTNILVSVRKLSSDPVTAPVSRPDHFTPDQADIGTCAEFADIDCGATAYGFAFIEHGTKLYAHLYVGRDAKPARLDEAYGILDSLRVDE